MKNFFAFIRENTWTVAFVVVLAVNGIILQRYDNLNDDFKQSLTESCINRKTARDAYRFIIKATAEGHPRESEIVEYTETYLPPVEC